MSAIEHQKMHETFLKTIDSTCFLIHPVGIIEHMFVNDLTPKPCGFLVDGLRTAWSSQSSIVDGDDAMSRLVELEKASRFIEAARAEVLAEVDRTGAFRDHGHTTMAGWLRAGISYSAGDAKHHVKVARMVVEFPQISQRLQAGTIGVAQVRRLAAAHANKRVSAELPAFVDMLADRAEDMPYEDFNSVMIRWEHYADADGAHRDSERVHEDRDATVHPVGDVVYVDAKVGTAQGAFMLEVFEKYVQAELAQDLADRDAKGLDLYSDLARTAKQRRADAMYAIFASAANGRFAPAEPVVNIVIDAATYETALSALLNDMPLPSLLGSPDSFGLRRCETTAGVAIDPFDAIVASMIGQVRRVVMSSPSTVIDLGRKSRLFTGSSREAIFLRRRKCIWPGCSALTCEADHRTPWSEGGTTSPDNGDPLCRKHNRYKATAGYTTTIDHTTGISHVYASNFQRLTVI
jgi:hypothetical protein